MTLGLVGHHRYINNKSTKYQLRASGATKGASVSGAGSQEAGLVPFTREGALATFALFTKHDGDVEANLKSMQVSWVANECGQAALKCNEIGPALKKFLDVEKVAPRRCFFFALFLFLSLVWHLLLET